MLPVYGLDRGFKIRAVRYARVETGQPSTQDAARWQIALAPAQLPCSSAAERLARRAHSREQGQPGEILATARGWAQELPNRVANEAGHGCEDLSWGQSKLGVVTGTSCESTDEVESTDAESEQRFDKPSVEQGVLG